MTSLTLHFRRLEQGWEHFFERAESLIAVQGVYWLPLFAILGVSQFFALSAEPSLSFLLISLAVFGLALWRYSEKLPFVLRSVFIAAFVWHLGFTAASVQGHLVNTKALQTESPYSETITGEVLRVEHMEAGKTRILFKVDQAATAILRKPWYRPIPDMVRIHLTRKSARPKVGDRFTVRTVLQPVSGAALPKGFDFQRYLFFQGVGAVGYAVQRLTFEDYIPPPNMTLPRKLDEMRLKIRESLKAHMPETSATIGTALITGEQREIPSVDLDALRAAGLSHLLAISGMQIGMVGLMVFFLVRQLACLWPVLVLRLPIKSFAAVVGLAVATAYTIFVSSPLTTLRSILMLGVATLAIVLMRRSMGLRVVCLAALLLAIVLPEASMGPSFQLSFMAVVTLIVAYRDLRLRNLENEMMGDSQIAVVQGFAGVMRWFRHTFVDCAITSLAITITTAAIVQFHFQKVPVYGVIGNIFAVPMFNFVIMPAGLLGVFLIPFDLQAYPFKVMDWGIVQILNVSKAIQEWPFASLQLPPMEPWLLWLNVVGVLWVCFSSKVSRWWGLIPMVVSFSVPFFMPKPFLLVAPDMATIGLRVDVAQGTIESVLAVPSIRREKFIHEVWRDYLGVKRDISWSDMAEASKQMRCDSGGCQYHLSGLEGGGSGSKGQGAKPPLEPLPWIGFPNYAESAMLYCAEGASLIIAPFPVPKDLCPNAKVIDSTVTQQSGAQAVYWQNNGQDGNSLKIQQAFPNTRERLWQMGE